MVEDEAAFGGDARRFLGVIADMQREAEQRRRVLEELREKEAAARRELQECAGGHEALRAQMAQTEAEGLLLDVEYNELCAEQRALEGRTVELQRLKRQREKLLRLYQSSSSSHVMPCGGGSSDGAPSKNNMSQIDRAMLAWCQLPHSTGILQELKGAFVELLTKVNAASRSRSSECIGIHSLENDVANDCSSVNFDPLVIIPHLPSLSAVERAILSLIPFSP